MAEVSTVYNYNQSSIPPWMQTAIQDILNRGTSLANEPYQPYTGPRVAGLNADQQASFGAVRDNMTAPHMNWTGAGSGLVHTGAMTNTAQLGDQFQGIGSSLAHTSGMMNTADNISTGAAGAPQFDEATGMFRNTANVDTAGIATPLVQQGTGYLQQSTQGSGAAAANPYIQQALSAQGLAAAQPYLSAAGTSFPGMSDAYMQPWMTGVNDRIAELGARNLNEYLLPGISDQFIRAGQFGSAQQRDVVGRALRDTQESVLGQQAQTLERGYGQAQQAYAQDAARYAGLAGTAGGLGANQQQQLLAAGQTVGSLTSQDMQRLAEAGVNLGQFGISQAGLAANDQQRALAAAQGITGIGQSYVQAAQADAARQAASRQADAARMLQSGQVVGDLGTARAAAGATDAARMVAGGTALGGLASTQNSMNLQNAGALGAVGDQQQGQVQTNLNVGYDDYMRQQQQPWDNLGRLSNMVNGLPSSTTSYGTQTSSSPSPSVASQIGGIALGGIGLANSGIFRAKGGAVRKYARGGRVRCEPKGIGGYRMAA